MKFNVHAGHNRKAPGASGCFSEVTEDRKVTNLVIEKLRELGHTVYDCTDDSGSTASAVLKNIVASCNCHKVDYDISIHFNAFNGLAHGTEVLCYNSKTHDVAKKILKEITKLGFTNRGIKDGKNLYVLKHTNSPAFLIECCFCDSKEDAKLYNAESMATAIVKGITGKTVKSGTDREPTKQEIAVETAEYYRVRKSWTDAKSQLGAYRRLDNAEANCPPGYAVFNEKGTCVYRNLEATNPLTNTVLYRVRKSWDNAASQLGAYKELENAKSNCPNGYKVYDHKGKAVYAPTDSTAKDTAEVPAAPTPSTISITKGMSQSQFVDFIGIRAREDMKKTGILASITTAQAILESGWGQSELILKANNVFGMKASLSGNTWKSDWVGNKYAMKSNEEINGVMKKVLSDFRSYKTIEDSIKDHSDYLNGAKRGSELRYKGLKGETDYTRAAKIIKFGGYSTDSEYVSKLSKLIKEYQLDVYDCVDGEGTEELTVTVPASEIDRLEKKADKNKDNPATLNKILNKMFKWFKK